MGSFYVWKGLKIEEIQYKVWITLIKKLGYKTYQKLIYKFGTLKGIWNANEKELLNIKNINKEVVCNLLNKEIKYNLSKHLKFMKENNIDIIYLEDREYPKNLKQIYDPPICLYIKGNKEIINNNNLAIIGCRDYSEYGKEIAFKFANEVSKNKINIVSGLAKGIDSFAHLGTIRAKEKTIAVIGNGIDSIYPKENINIAKEILKNNGAIISEYPLGTPPIRINFPARNRIISGISDGVLVIEAKEKSGTLITVDFALEQGKTIFAIPGNINSYNSIGTNELIKQGAILVNNVQDILTEF